MVRRSHAAPKRQIDNYTAAAMLADLGPQRLENLPLEGALLHQDETLSISDSPGPEGEAIARWSRYANNEAAEFGELEENKVLENGIGLGGSYRKVGQKGLDSPLIQESGLSRGLLRSPEPAESKAGVGRQGTSYSMQFPPPQPEHEISQGARPKGRPDKSQKYGQLVTRRMNKDFGASLGGWSNCASTGTDSKLRNTNGVKISEPPNLLPHKNATTPQNLGRCQVVSKHSGLSQDSKVPKGPKISQDSNIPKGPKISQDSNIPKGPKVLQYSNVPKGPRASYGSNVPKGPRASYGSNVPKGPKALRDSNVPKGLNALQVPNVPKGPRASYGSNVPKGPYFSNASKAAHVTNGITARAIPAFHHTRRDIFALITSRSTPRASSNVVPPASLPQSFRPRNAATPITAAHSRESRKLVLDTSITHGYLKHERDKALAKGSSSDAESSPLIDLISFTESSPLIDLVSPAESSPLIDLISMDESIPLIELVSISEQKLASATPIRAASSRKTMRLVSDTSFIHQYLKSERYKALAKRNSNGVQSSPLIDLVSIAEQKLDLRGAASVSDGLNMDLMDLYSGQKNDALVATESDKNQFFLPKLSSKPVDFVTPGLSGSKYAEPAPSGLSTSKYASLGKSGLSASKYTSPGLAGSNWAAQGASGLSASKYAALGASCLSASKYADPGLSDKYAAPGASGLPVSKYVIPAALGLSASKYASDGIVKPPLTGHTAPTFSGFSESLYSGLAAEQFDSSGGLHDPAKSKYALHQLRGVETVEPEYPVSHIEILAVLMNGEKKGDEAQDMRVSIRETDLLKESKQNALLIEVEEGPPVQENDSSRQRLLDKITAGHKSTIRWQIRRLLRRYAGTN